MRGAHEVSDLRNEQISHGEKSSCEMAGNGKLRRNCEQEEAVLHFHI